MVTTRNSTLVRSVDFGRLTERTRNNQSLQRGTDERRWSVDVELCFGKHRSRLEFLNAVLTSAAFCWRSAVDLSAAVFLFKHDTGRRSNQG